MKNKNNVKVNVRFSCEKDDNLDLLNLKARISYHLPEEIGFTKRKELEITLIKDTTFSLWIKEVKNLMAGSRIKNVIYNEIKEHIMTRLRNAQKTNPDAVANILNMFNQMKFEFHFDVVEAESIILAEQEALRKKDREDTFFDD